MINGSNSRGDLFLVRKICSDFILTCGLQIGTGNYYNKTNSATPPENGWEKIRERSASRMRIEYVKAAPTGWTKIWDDRTNTLRYHHTQRNETVDTIDEANTSDDQIQSVFNHIFKLESHIFKIYTRQPTDHKGGKGKKERKSENHDFVCVCINICIYIYI